MNLNIDPTNGSWIGDLPPSSKRTDSDLPHKFDVNLGHCIRDCIIDRKLKSVIDLGCGNADYARLLIQSNLEVECYDGNPFTPKMTGGLAKILDVGELFTLGRCFDVSLCLEVGEHIPRSRESNLLANLLTHTAHMMIVSWAIPGQGGIGHVNERPNDYIEDRITAETDWNRCDAIESKLRDSASFWWFKNTTMVFSRSSSQSITIS